MKLIFSFLLTFITMNDTFAQTQWTKYHGNPVLEPGPPVSWDRSRAGFPEVISDGVTFQMWYAGLNIEGDILFWRTGYATSPDGFTWTKHDSNPVLDVGAPGSWEDEQVLPGAVVFNGTTYRMWYFGYDGTFYRSGYATSPDGFTWTKSGANPVMDLGSAGAWDDTWAGITSVISDGDTLHAWYLGNDGSTQQTGYATSTDGVTWDKYAGNPVIGPGVSGSWDDAFISGETVLFDGSTYEMWYEGNDGNTSRIGYATSTDRINWTKSEENPVLNIGPSGSWDAQDIFIPSMFFDGVSYHMWYDGRVSDFDHVGYAISHPGIERVEEVTVSPSYAIPGTDVLTINVSVTDPQGLDILAEIESPDMTPLDSLQLFDDGAHNDGAAGDSVFGNDWPVPAVEERDYSVDLLVTLGDTFSFQVHNVGLFTTIGPVVYESSTILINTGATAFFNMTLRNEGLTATAPLILGQISTTDSCITEFNADASSFGDILAGESAMSKGNYSVDLNQNCVGDEIIEFTLDMLSNGHVFWTDSFSTQLVVVAITDEEAFVPDEYSLAQNYPNPFNPLTKIEYALPRTGEVFLMIYGLRGEEVARLIDGRQQAGYHHVMWDASNMASGIYFYSLQAGDFVQTRKMVLLK